MRAKLFSKNVFLMILAFSMAVVLLTLSSCQSEKVMTPTEKGCLTYKGIEWGSNEGEVFKALGITEKDIIDIDYSDVIKNDEKDTTDASVYKSFYSTMYGKKCRIELVFENSSLVKGLSTVKVYFGDLDEKELYEKIKNEAKSLSDEYKVDDSSKKISSTLSIKDFCDKNNAQYDYSKVENAIKNNPNYADMANEAMSYVRTHSDSAFYTQYKDDSKVMEKYNQYISRYYITYSGFVAALANTTAKK